MWLITKTEITSNPAIVGPVFLSKRENPEGCVCYTAMKIH